MTFVGRHVVELQGSASAKQSTAQHSTAQHSTFAKVWQGRNRRALGVHQGLTGCVQLICFELWMASCPKLGRFMHVQLGTQV